MPAKERYEAVKDHVKKHKGAYIGVGLGVLVGLVTGALATRQIKISQSANNVGFVWKPTNNLEQNILLVRRGHPGNIIKCLETGETFASQNRTAEAMGLNASELSEHVRGLRGDVGGYHFEKIGEAI